mgnify:CR=1 FL=1
MITGGFGFVGSHLSEALVKNHKLILLTRSKKKWKNIEKIAKKLKLRHMPKITFQLDKTFDYADKIEKLLKDPKVIKDL